VENEILQWDELEKSLPNSATPIVSPHISLSRPFFLARHEVEAFRSLLDRSVKGTGCFTVGFSSEPIFLTSEAEVTFCALRVTRGSEMLSLLLSGVDEVLSKYGRELYYPERILHASLTVWAKDEPQKLKDAWSGPPIIKVESIIFKAGHNHHNIALSSS
jgi:hypothetical protein